MSSCFGFRKKTRSHEEREPLLPVYNDETSLQQEVHKKLHSYQMLRALSMGFMPTTEQTVINLRTILSSEVLNPATPGLSESGRKLAKYSKQLLQEFIDLLKNKNDENQLQDFIWFVLNAKVDVDTGDLIQTTRDAKAKADLSAAYESIRTVGSLLLTNSDFRLFLSDLNTIGRQVFADTANTLSTVASEAADQVEPSTQEMDVIKEPGKDSRPISKRDLEEESAQISQVITDGLKETGQEAEESLKENVSGKQRESLVFRLKAAVKKLRKRNDYSDSVSTISLLLQRYAKVYSRAGDKTASVLQEDITANDELDKAVRSGWSLISSFGDREAWKELERRLSKVVEHSQKDPEYESMMMEVSASIQKMFTDPEFFDSASRDIDELRERSKKVGPASPLRQDVDALLHQTHIVFDSVVNDNDIKKLLSICLKIWPILSPTNTSTNQDILTDATTIFLPFLISSLQYIPIPRLEIVSPELDLLLENLVLEPGRTVNNSSFLPFRLNLETYNALSLHKARLQTQTSTTSLATITLQGLSLRAQDIGYVLRTHKSLMRLSSSGLTSFALDERGIDISLTVDIRKNNPASILSLRDVDVKIHHLTYTLQKTKFSFLAWLFKPLLRPLIRGVLERKLEAGIRDFLHGADREVVFARERLRAARIADPRDLGTFVRAVCARFRTEGGDGEGYARVGIEGEARERGAVFEGVYAPGSVVRLWREEAVRAEEVVYDGAARGWRNEIFDVQSMSV